MYSMLPALLYVGRCVCIYVLTFPSMNHQTPVLVHSADCSLGPYFIFLLVSRALYVLRTLTLTHRGEFCLLFLWVLFVVIL